MMAIDIRMWHQRISRARQLQSEHTPAREMALELYQGTFFGNQLADNMTNDLTEVNFVYEFVKMSIAAIYAKDPRIMVRSRISKWDAFAETMETVINYYWKEKKLKQKIKKAIVDGVLQPPGWVAIGYLLLTEMAREKNEIIKVAPELKDVIPDSDKVEAQLGILDETIKDDDIFAEYISSWKILWPDGYDNRRDAPYLIMEQELSLEDVENNTSFKNSRFRINQSLAAASYSNEITSYKMSANLPMGTSSSTQDKELIKVKLFHVWDKRSQKRFVLAENFDEDTLFEGDWDYLIDGFPFYDLSFNEIPSSRESANSYPLSDVVPMIPQLKELSYVSSAMNRHRKRAGTVIMVDGEIIGEDTATNIMTASDVDIIRIPGLTKDSIHGYTPPPLPSDFYRLREIYLEDLMRISGYNQLLSTATGVETATESENVRLGAVLRQSERADVVEDFTVEIARGMAGLIWQFIQDKSRIAEIIGEEVNDSMWPTLPENKSLARKIIQKELTFSIEAGSTRPPKDEAVERKQLMDLVGIVKANFPGRLKDDIILKQILKKFPLMDIDQAVIGFDEEEKQAAIQENELLEQNIIQIVTPNEAHEIHISIHSQMKNKTDAWDTHILSHAEMLQKKAPELFPQKGDSKTAPRTNSPDQRRGGVPEMVDFVGAINKSSGIGGNNGGGINA